jgi:hypothetical protein
MCINNGNIKNNDEKIKKIISCKSEAIVVFDDSNSFLFLKFLKKNFRHCFVLVKCRGGWIICDPLSNFVDVTILQGMSAKEIVDFYSNIGVPVIRTFVRKPPCSPAPVQIFTCVEVVKRILGIHARWVLTPWRLYLYLQRGK